MKKYIECEALIDYLTRPTGQKATCDGCCDIDCVDCIRDEVIKNLPAADVVEVDKVAEMLQFMFGDECACNYGGIDEWLPWTCKYAETECPEPKEKFACWKEFIKAFMKRMNTD